MKTLFSIIVCLLFLQSCVTKNKQDILGSSACDTSNITFSNTIQPMALKYCTSCHGGASPSSNISLEGYDNINYYATDCYNSMLSGSMPQSAPRVDDCTIRKFKMWIDAGKPNN